MDELCHATIAVFLSIFFTARIRRMGEGNVFSLSTSGGGGVSPASGGGQSSQGGWVSPAGGSVQSGGVSPARGVSQPGGVSRGGVSQDRTTE